mmetsp:Transcript_16623/g.14521  ORF Transcript_16623/g.14521 Transcript_16623/m.14521 type:complete len:91 (+) Transcript_16623:468-740(+)
MQISEVVLAMLNLVLTWVILRKFSRNLQDRQYSIGEDDTGNVGQILLEDKTISMKRLQIKILSRGLFVYTIIFAALSIVGDLMMARKNGF